MAKKINYFTLVFSKDKGVIYALTEFFTDNFRDIQLVSQKEVNNTESLEGKWEGFYSVFQRETQKLSH